MKKLLALALVAVMSLSLLVGCGGKEDPQGGEQPAGPEEIKLTVWCPQNQVESGIMEEQQKAFAEANKDKWTITWDLNVVGEDVVKDQILNDVEAAGDVFFFANDQVVALAEAGAIAKLGGSTREMVESTMAESVVNTAKIGDDLYGIPFTHNTFFMYYDKSIMTEEDVKTLEGIINKDTAEGVYNFFFDGAGGWKAGAWYYAAGLHVFGPNGDDLAAGCDWNSATGVAVTKYLMDMAANEKVAFENGIAVAELIAEHKLGAWFDGEWNYKLYKDALGDDLGLAVLPTINVEGKDCQLLSFYGSKCIGVNARSKHPAAANAFAAFLGSEEQQVLRFEKSAQAPTNLAAGENPAVLADEKLATLVAQSNTATVAQPTAAIFTNRYWSNVGALLTEIKTGNVTDANVQEQLDKFVEIVTMAE